MDVKSRHHLRSDEIGEIRTALSDRLGVSLDGDAFELVELTDTPFDLVLVDGNPDVLYVDGDPFVTVRGANDHPPETGVVTVDAGAVSFVSDGADVMRPGIVDADDDISPGELVPIAEESHGKVLAVGRALVDGARWSARRGRWWSRSTTSATTSTSSWCRPSSEFSVRVDRRSTVSRSSNSGDAVENSRLLGAAVTLVRLAGTGALVAGLSSWLLTDAGSSVTPAALIVGGLLLLLIVPGLLVASTEVV
ncbi:MAG: putative RNA-binding protein (contains PUA domain) [halophilic archaeon J07HB67]|jgi:RNA-binding protein, containing PUA domain|nr:MAG: putative RNA-binding protein (contains PUA domain) [halophilic archaeon J07HB67]